MRLILFLSAYALWRADNCHTSSCEAVIGRSATLPIGTEIRWSAEAFALQILFCPF